MYYILDKDKNPVQATLEQFAKFCEQQGDKVVQQDKLPNGTFVSTVFLGLDHQFGDGPPILFETMIFGGEHDQYQERYCTWTEAVKGHRKALSLIDNITP